MPNIYHTNRTLRVSLRSSSDFQISLLLFQFKGEVDGIFSCCVHCTLQKRDGADLSGWMMSTSKWTRTPQKPCTHLRIRPHSQQRYWIVEAQQKPETIKFSCKFKRLEMEWMGGSREIWIVNRTTAVARRRHGLVLNFNFSTLSSIIPTQLFFVGKKSQFFFLAIEASTYKTKASMGEKEKHGKVFGRQTQSFFFFLSTHFILAGISRFFFFWIRIVSGCGFSGCYRKYQWLIPFYKIWITAVNLWD